MDELLAQVDVARRLRLSVVRIRQLREEGVFPVPLAKVANGRWAIWTASQIRAWALDEGRPFYEDEAA